MMVWKLSVFLILYLHSVLFIRGQDNVTRTRDNIPAIFGNEKTGIEYELLRNVLRNGSTCKHIDTFRRIQVFDIKTKAKRDNDSTAEFQCNDATSESWDFTNGGYSPRNDVYRNAQRFVDMWKRLVPEVQPYRNEESYLTFLVHYRVNTSNAAFTASGFKFGDGNYKSNHPWSGLDMVCHEIGHYITWLLRGPRLIYPEASALNEAYSDILGETCDMYWLGKRNYLLGDDIVMKDGWYIRDLCHPSNVEKCNYWSRPGLEDFSQFDPELTSHQKGGLYNKAWCLLSQMDGWDYITAFQVFTRANRCYWRSTETMHGGVCGLLRAAHDLCHSVNDISTAFRQVGLWCVESQRKINKCKGIWEIRN